MNRSFLNHDHPDVAGMRTRDAQRLAAHQPGWSRFTQHMDQAEVVGLVEQGELVSGVIRINGKKRVEAYVKVEGIAHDVWISGDINRNRSFSKDLVAVRLLPSQEWRFRDSQDASKACQPPKLPSNRHRVGEDEETQGQLLKWAQEEITLQPQGVVVSVLENRHQAFQIGSLVPASGDTVKDRDKFANFIPVDLAMYKILIPLEQCPAGFKEKPQDFREALFGCELLDDWGHEEALPRGKLVKRLGDFGDIEAETEALLMQNEVDSAPFDDEIERELLERHPQGWSIPEEEIAKRRDLRETCIFTIDPPTARDLDDALHCFKLPNGNFEVGVHIMD